MKNFIFFLSFFFIVTAAQAQSHVFLFSPRAAGAIVGRPPEHGYKWLKGKKIKFYPTIDKYDFKGKRLRVEVYDNRAELQLQHIACSQTEINNTSEYAGESGVNVVCEYIQTLFPEANLIVGSAATEVLKINIEGLDCRLFGSPYITPHSLCQLHCQLNNLNKTYCCDITDKDEHTPISRWALVERSTATRVMLSASIREVIEQFLKDLKEM